MLFGFLHKMIYAYKYLGVVVFVLTAEITANQHAYKDGALMV